MSTQLNLYNYNSYKKFLADWIDTVGGRGSLTRIAEAAGCHRTYLSQVLNSKVDLTLDHAASLISFFKFGATEADYFLTCVMHERSTQTAAKDYFRKKLDKAAKQQSTVSARMPSSIQENSRADVGTYYSNASVAMIHIATSCPSTQTVSQISHKFGLPTEHVAKTLEYLLARELVTKSDSRFIHSGKILHLDRDSEFTRINHLNWRLRSCEDSQNDESVHYTNVFSISKRDWHGLKVRLLDFIESQNKHIHASGTEDVVVFCCDLFSPIK